MDKLEIIKYLVSLEKLRIQVGQTTETGLSLAEISEKVSERYGVSLVKTTPSDLYQKPWGKLTKKERNEYTQIKRTLASNKLNILIVKKEEFDLAKECIRLPLGIGDKIYFEDFDFSSHGTAYIDQIQIDSQGISFSWSNYDYGPEGRELWDSDDFTIDDIGKSVFISEDHVLAKRKADKEIKDEV